MTVQGDERLARLSSRLAFLFAGNGAANCSEIRPSRHANARWTHASVFAEIRDEQHFWNDPQNLVPIRIFGLPTPRISD
jgi:hypothetical protein